MRGRVAAAVLAVAVTAHPSPGRVVFQQGTQRGAHTRESELEVLRTTMKARARAKVK
jgi:hypothetical protein